MRVDYRSCRRSLLLRSKNEKPKKYGRYSDKKTPPLAAPNTNAMETKREAKWYRLFCIVHSNSICIRNRCLHIWWMHSVRPEDFFSGTQQVRMQFRNENDGIFIRKRSKGKHLIELETMETTTTMTTPMTTQNCKHKTNTNFSLGNFPANQNKKLPEKRNNTKWMDMGYSRRKKVQQTNENFLHCFRCIFDSTNVSNERHFVCT